MATHLGSGVYTAPEILRKSETYTNKCDLWSLGFIVFMSYANAYPFEGMNRLFNPTYQDILKTITEIDWNPNIWDESNKEL